MKHLRKTLSILLALALLLALVPSALAADDMSEEANLVFYVMGDAPKDEAMVEDAINAVLKEKFNATVDFQFSTWTDFSLKYNNQLTSGGADLIYIANWLDYGLLARAGAFLELDDLLNEYAPELRALAGEDMLNMCRVEGELYAVPALWPEYVPIGIKYREDLRKKYDLPYPDSLENIEAYFAGVKANEPDQPILRCTTSESASSLFVAFDAATMLNIKYPWVGNNGLPYGLAANYDTPDQARSVLHTLRLRHAGPGLRLLVLRRFRRRHEADEEVGGHGLLVQERAERQQRQRSVHQRAVHRGSGGHEPQQADFLREHLCHRTS